MVQKMFNRITNRKCVPDQVRHKLATEDQSRNHGRHKTKTHNVYLLHFVLLLVFISSNGKKQKVGPDHTT